MVFSSPACGADLTETFDAQHRSCLEQIAKDADLAYEEAMIWRGDGGGRRARHCEAMALFALGHTAEAAHRLHSLAASNQGGSNEMKANTYAEAANFWLMAREPHQAFEAADAGLKLSGEHTACRVARARAYAMLKRYDYAEIDLTSALVFEPDNADIYRYRADARFEQGKLDGAKSDIERALDLDMTRVETALLRGRINESLRQAKAEGGE
ncbi:MAG: hypothetical protein GDA35_07305 [Hyphomonadaceae bacterium]|nr:hypothetical protein [Hyphomonadaceae bacterium]